MIYYIEGKALESKKKFQCFLSCMEKNTKKVQNKRKKACNLEKLLLY